MEFLSDYYQVFLIAHLFALVLGLGGATYSDLLLFKFLKDFKISRIEANIIETMSKAVMVGVFVALISGIGLALPKWDVLATSSKFLVKIVAFGVLLVNGICLHSFILPRLIHFTFLKEHFMVSKIIHLRHLSFMMGAISVVSWYTVFILGTFKSVPLTFTELFLIYLGLLLVAVIVALLVENRIAQIVQEQK